MDSDELFLPVEYTSIEEILRNKRSNIPPGDHEQETENHTSRLSTVSTVYQGLQDKDRHQEERPGLVNEDHGYGAILNKNHGKKTRNVNLDNVQDTWNGKDRKGHKHKTKQRGFKQRTSQYQNTLPDFRVVERIMQNQNRNKYTHHLTHAIEKYFKDFSNTSDQDLPRSFVDASKHLPCYLDNSIMEVFYQLDTNQTGKVSMKDFIHVCEVLEINIVDGDHLSSSQDYEGKATLPKSKSRNEKLNKLWTEDQRPLWDLCVNKKKESLNAEEFKICLLENWAAKHVKVKKVRGINVTQCLESSQSLIKNTILNRVYTNSTKHQDLFEQTKEQIMILSLKSQMMLPHKQV